MVVVVHTAFLGQAALLSYRKSTNFTYHLKIQSAKTM